jgi:hypothetical protein
MEKDEDEEMSNQGFQGVPGVPDGWELVEFRKPVKGDFVINWIGEIEQHKDCQPVFVFPIIRKIEVPKTYRPFANGAEFEPHRDRWVEVVSEDNNCGCDFDQGDIGGKRKIDGCNEYSVCIWEGWMTYGDAFECFVFDDGSPFGVEVTK